MYACLLSHFSRVQLSATSWTIALQGPLSMGFSRQEHLSGLQTLLQGISLTQGSNPRLLHLLHWEVGSLPLAPPGKPRHLRLLDKLTKHPLSGKCCGEDFLPTMECGLNPDVLEFSCVDLDEFGGEPRPFFQGVFPMSFFFSPTKPTPILLKMAPLSLNVLEHSVSHFV